MSKLETVKILCNKIEFHSDTNLFEKHFTILIVSYTR